MGCAGSKQARHDRRRSPTPLDRCYSAPVSRHHVVSLKATTLGSLELDPIDDEFSEEEENDLNRRIPRPPTKTPPDEPETINAWELMAGLDESPSPIPAAVGRSVSFNAFQSTAAGGHEWAAYHPKLIKASPPTNRDNSIVSDFNPETIASFRKALQELSPERRFLLRSPEPEKMASWNRHFTDDDAPKYTGTGEDGTKPTGIVRARITAFQERINSRKAGSAKANPRDGEGKVVLFFTSLRGVRKTYEDCSTVRAILQSYGVKLDDRDVSMHAGFKDELNELLGPGFGGRSLPRVFAHGRCLGGAEELRQLHEAGELREALGGCEMVADGRGRGCEGCGDVRFVPCETCSGSCKVFAEEEEEEDVGGGFRRCPDCNENGLVRCPLCC